MRSIGDLFRSVPSNLSSRESHAMGRLRPGRARSRAGVAALVAVSALASVSVPTAVAGSNDNTRPSIRTAAVVEVGPSGWSGYSETSDTVSGWGDEEWRLPLTRAEWVSVSVVDCCRVGDNYAVYIDGGLIGTTPQRALGGDTPSKGTFARYVPAGLHVVTVQDLGGIKYYNEGVTSMIPAGYEVVISRTAPAQATATTAGSRVTVAASRDGWGARVRVTVQDTSDDGACAYARVTVNVTGAGDASRRSDDDCKANGTATTETYSLRAGMFGTSIGSISLRACRDRRSLPDQCSSTLKVDLPQMTAARDADMADMERIEGLPLSVFLGEKAEAVSPYDWSDDGCSSPIELAKVVSDLVLRRFESSCQRHDWGYRNFGKLDTKGFQPTDSRRRKVDDLLLRDMLEQCDITYPGWAQCAAKAEVVYAAVRIGGSRSFYGR